MRIPFAENPTRQQIIKHLKLNETLTASELSDEMGISKMSVRQHLVYLKEQGNIRYTLKKSGVGRPIHQYSLTEKANDMFPKDYGNFISDVLGAIVDLDGKKKLENILRMRKFQLLDEMKGVLRESEGFPDKVAMLAGHLNRKGHMVELDKVKGGYHMKKYNCLLSEVVIEFPEICKYELKLYRKLLGKGVFRREWLRKGAPFCEYVIYKA
jgi:predicted ArsR family transcriptional regulator